MSKGGTWKQFRDRAKRADHIVREKAVRARIENATDHRALKAELMSVWSRLVKNQIGLSEAGERLQDLGEQFVALGKAAVGK